MPKPPKRPAPISVRLTPEELSQLDHNAAGMSMSRNSYMRWRLLNPDNPPPRRRTRKPPVKDHPLLAQVLGILARSNLPSNLNQLAKAANSGSLPVTPDTEAALMAAVADVREMRRMLIAALGLEVEP